MSERYVKFGYSRSIVGILSPEDQGVFLRKGNLILASNIISINDLVDILELTIRNLHKVCTSTGILRTSIPP